MSLTKRTVSFRAKAGSVIAESAHEPGVCGRSHEHEAAELRFRIALNILPFDFERELFGQFPYIRLQRINAEHFVENLQSAFV